MSLSVSVCAQVLGSAKKQQSCIKHDRLTREHLGGGGLAIASATLKPVADVNEGDDGCPI